MKDTLARSRLLVYAGAAALGGVLGKGGGASSLCSLALAAILSLAVICARRRGWREAWALVCLLFFCAGLYMGYSSYSAWRGRGGTAGEVVLVGTVEVGCRGERGDIIDLFRVEEVASGGVARAGDRYLMHHGGGDGVSPRWGDRLLVKGNLYIFDGEGGGVGGSLRADEITPLSHTGNPLLRLALTYREAFRASMEEVEDETAAGLLQGMVLGDYRLLGARDLKAFRLTGLIHLCAASGMNLAILAGFVVWLGRKARLSSRAILLLQAPILITYALAVGLSVPIIRATVVALTAVTAHLLGRDFDLLPAMGAAALLLLWDDPGAAAGVSFQLCFAAALGMVVLYRPLLELMRAKRSKVLALLAASLSAQLAVAPILLYHFGEVSLLAPLSNLLVLPLVPPVMALAMLSSLLGMAGLPLAGTIMQAAACISRAILAVARALSSPGWAVLRAFPFSPLWMAVYYPALGAALLGKGGPRRAGRVIMALLMAAATLMAVAPHLRQLGEATEARITFIDVGQGDAALLQAPAGTTVLVDGGISERTLMADLKSRGVHAIDAVVVSHTDADHIGGLEGALEDCEVGMLVHPDTRSSGQAGRLLALAEEMGVDVRTMRAGDRLDLGETRLVACWPPQELAEGASVNEYSLVLRVSGPGYSLLLSGDIGGEGQELMLEGEEEMDCDILKVPHHGGFSPQNEELFSRVDPEIAVVSVGADNPYGHPARATITALQRSGCAVYRTDERGDIVIRVVRGGYRVECER
ncbi:MAG: DNA internalization-related competence protein ComEC/Rec2 [Actinomycetota bacterium]